MRKFFPSRILIKEITGIIPTRKALKILLITDSLVLLAGATLGPIYALFVEKIGGDLLDASLTGAIFAAAAGITVVLSGKYSDRLKQPEFIVVFGYSVMGIGYLLYILVNSIWFLFLVQIMIGFGEAVYNSPFDALYSRHLPDHHEGEGWGFWEAMNYWVAAIGGVIGGLVVTNLGFNTLFILMASLCFLSAIYVYRLPRQVL